VHASSPLIIFQSPMTAYLASRMSERGVGVVFNKVSNNPMCSRRHGTNDDGGPALHSKDEDDGGERNTRH